MLIIRQSLVAFPNDLLVLPALASLLVFLHLVLVEAPKMPWHLFHDLLFFLGLNSLMPVPIRVVPEIVVRKGPVFRLENPPLRVF